MRLSERPPLSQVIFVTGKGGVGKTTVSAGMAAAVASAGGRAALIEFGDGESGKRALGKSRKGIDHIVIAPHESVVQAAGPLFGSAMLAKIALGNFAVNRLVRAAPAVRELAMLECVRAAAAEDPRRRIIVDLPATGHGIAWLRVAAQVRDVTIAGPLHDLAARIVKELINPAHCSIVVVTLPERLVLRETLELCGALEREVQLPATRLIINRVPEALPEDAFDEARTFMASSDELSVEAGFLAHALDARMQSRTEALDALREASDVTRLAPVLLPDIGTDPPASRVGEWLRGEEAV